MGLFDWLIPAGRTAKPADSIRIEPGLGFTFDLVGEADYQDRLDRICGGKREDGHNKEITAQLVFISDNEHDQNAIGVMIEGELVGFIPKGETLRLRADLVRWINPSQRPILCSAKIVGGWDRGDGDQGHYGVKLSLSKPPRIM